MQKMIYNAPEVRQKVIDFFRSDPDLSGCYTDLSALFEEVDGLKLWELPKEKQIKRANTFVQSAALHFDEFIKDFNNPVEPDEHQRH
jgi:hypothetical protein